MVKMAIWIKSLWNDQGGASAAEYALILAVIGTAIGLAAITLGRSISGAFNSASNCVSGKGC